MEHPFLIDFKPEGKAIANWQFLELDEYTRLYYEAIPKEGRGFNFYALALIGTECGYNNWNIARSQVKCLLHGEASFDGIRHLWLGHELTENQGYAFYPDTDQFIAVFTALKTLASIYCREK